MACPGYEPPNDINTDDDYNITTCDEILFETLKCDYPVCKEINGTIDLSSSNAGLVGDNFTATVGTNVTFACNEQCELRFIADIDVSFKMVNIISQTKPSESNL